MTTIYTHNDTTHCYTYENLEDLEDADMISPIEQAFMQGYLEE